MIALKIEERITRFVGKMNDIKNKNSKIKITEKKGENCF